MANRKQVHSQNQTSEDMKSQIQHSLGVVSFQLMQQQKTIDELRQEYDKLYAQLAALQGVKTSDEIISDYEKEMKNTQKEPKEIK